MILHWSSLIDGSLTALGGLTTVDTTPHIMDISHVPTAATLCGQLVIIGGRREGSSVKPIHQWGEIGSMSHSRRECLVVSPSGITREDGSIG